MQRLLRVLRQIEPNRDGDQQRDVPLCIERSLNRDESFRNLPKPSKFVQRILPA
jgi:hypothetical protein